jgi:protein involved in polysaccharide export with SLBB domain
MHLTQMTLLVAALALSGTALAQDFGVTGLGSKPVSAPVDPERAAWEKANAAAARAAETGELPEGATAADTTAYKLGAGDKIKMTVFGEEDLSGEFEIDGTGTMSLPLVGDLKAGNLTARELEKAITRKLSDGYLTNPRVNVEVMNFRPFFIYGEVTTPGAYPYVNGLTVINAVALAGGYTPRAKTKTVVLRRLVDGQRVETQEAEDAAVFPGDVLQVKERFF